MVGWLRALRRWRAPAESDTVAGDPLWVIVPPQGVRLLSSRRSRTGEGGQGVVARYSDGTTASAMLNTDGSLRVIFFRDGQSVPAVELPSGAESPPARRRFTWQR